jgi:hypothetical protein
MGRSCSEAWKALVSRMVCGVGFAEAFLVFDRVDLPVADFDRCVVDDLPAAVWGDVFVVDFLLGFEVDVLCPAGAITRAPIRGASARR